MARHTENSAVLTLRSLGVNFKNKVMEAGVGSLGIKAWGMVDYLVNSHKYVMALKKK